MPAIIILVSLLFVGMLAIGFAIEQFKSPIQIFFETLGMLLVFAGCGACLFMIFLL